MPRTPAEWPNPGIDLLVAQGHEGGGHTGRIGTMALLPQAIDAAYPVPVLAAGESATVGGWLRPWQWAA